MSDYIEDLKSILQTKQGRNVLWKILEQANVFGMSYTGEVNSTFFNEGARSAGNRLLVQIQQASPESFLLMQKEHLEKIQAENSRKEKEREQVD